jgi:hypothetical protein
MNLADSFKHNSELTVQRKRCKYIITKYISLKMLNTADHFVLFKRWGHMQQYKLS